LVTSDGVIAVDALPTMGERQVAAIREVTDKPIRYLVYSHEHTDHIGAASLFPSGIKIVAQAETAAISQKRKDPRRHVPTVTFHNHLTLPLGEPKTGAHLSGPQSSDRQHHHLGAAAKVLVDVVYPGYMPYKNLGIVEDVPGYIDVHRTVLGYDFDTFVGGHVDRLGNRADVATSVEFVTELHSVASRLLSKTPFPAFLAAHAGPDKWDLDNEYERALVEDCAAELGKTWEARLKGTKTYLKDNCWAMNEAITVQMPPSPDAVGKKQ
jgi:hypothetical protein